MKIPELALLALQNVSRAGRQAILTALSVAIGVAAVILISSAGEGGQKVIAAEFERIGVSGLTVYKKTVPAAGSGRMEAEDAARLAASLSEVKKAVPVVLEYGAFRLRGEAGDAMLWGVGEGLGDVLSVRLLHGRLTNGIDVRFQANVALVDDTLAMKAYKRSNIVGKEILLSAAGRQERFTVIGVIQSQKSGLDGLTGGRLPEFIYIPYTSLNAMTGMEGVTQIAVKCAAGASLSGAGEQVVRYLNRLHRGEEYAAENMSGYIENFRNIAGLVALVLSAVASVSLVVSGFGVMNTMISSVRERKGEIGIYMAIGARKQDIVLLFLFESVLLCLSGGFCGALLGGLLSFAVRLPGVALSLSAPSVLRAELICVVCGLLFGVLPAARAASLDPIAALREE